MTFPPFRWSCNDDEMVLLAILQVGRANRLPAHESTAISVNDHDTHWLLFVRYVGHKDPAENGYQLHSWPKDSVDYATYKTEAEAMIDLIKS